MEIKNSTVVEGEKGLFSTKKYKKDQVIFVLQGEPIDYPTQHSIHIGDNKHVMDLWGIYMNHSFRPTTRIEKRNVVAEMDIGVGQELTFNYNDSETTMASPFFVDGVKVGGKKF